MSIQTTSPSMARPMQPGQQHENATSRIIETTCMKWIPLDAKACRYFGMDIFAGGEVIAYMGKVVYRTT